MNYYIYIKCGEIFNISKEKNANTHVADTIIQIINDECTVIKNSDDLPKEEIKEIFSHFAYNLFYDVVF